MNSDEMLRITELALLDNIRVWLSCQMQNDRTLTIEGLKQQLQNHFGLPFNLIAEEVHKEQTVERDYIPD
jgi:hypothetical protein